MPLYQLFYEGEKPPKLLHLRGRKTAEEIAIGGSKKEGRFLARFRELLARIRKRDQQLPLYMARKLAKR